MKSILCVILLGVLCVELTVSQSSGEVTSTNTTQTDENIPFCDEVDNHPSTNSPSSSDPSNIPPEDSTDAPIPNSQQLASEITSLIKEIGSEGVEKDANLFRDSASGKVAEMSSIVHRMTDRQAEIDEIYSNVLPNLEESIDSRRKQASTYRDQIRMLNAKLRALIDSLDRSSYVQEQQKFLTIIDDLMRIQNNIEMSSLGSSPSYSRNTESHPANALVSVAQDVIKLAKTSQHNDPVPDESNVLAIMHALDLLELESSSRELPYRQRSLLLTKKVTSLLTRLISMFNEMRQKHKEFAKVHRESWSKEIDSLQQQSDDVNANLESVMDQSEFYINAYKRHHNRLQQLVKEQLKSLEDYNTTKSKIKQSGLDHQDVTAFRATQLKKFQELLHYLTFGNQEYTEQIYDFGCDGVVGSTTVTDLCGVCGGLNTTCMDCKGVPNGKAEMDICGVCDGEGRSCDYFCDGVADSGKVKDLCGECGGDSAQCVGCDGIPNSGMVLDRCGICGGDGSSCAESETPDVQPITLNSNQVKVFVRISLHDPYTIDWIQRNGAKVRDSVASVANLDASRVQILSASGQDNVVLDLNLIVEKASLDLVTSEVSQSIVDNSLRTTLASHGLSVPSLAIVEGPSPIVALV